MKTFITLAGLSLIVLACAKEKIQPNSINESAMEETFIEKTIPQSPLTVRKAEAYIGSVNQKKLRPSVEGVKMMNGFILVTIATPDYARMNFEVAGSKQLIRGEKVNLRQLELYYTTNRVLQSDKIVKSIVAFHPAVFKDFSIHPSMNAVDLKMGYSKYIFRYFYEL